MYSNPTLPKDIILDGDDEADRKTVEWLKQAIERREQKRSSVSTGS